jgi:proteasome assembly chaperone (PAC2) family protein
MFDAAKAGACLTWDHVPELRNPVFIAGFHGWSNAGSASSETLEYLIETLKPRPFATLSQEPFISFTLDRPVGQIEDGVIGHLESLVTELFSWHGPDGARDLILMLAKEPHLGWPTFAGTVLDVMIKLKASRLCTIGGVQDTVSHYAPPVISVVGSSPYMVSATTRLEDGIHPTEYFGPLSIHSYLIDTCANAGLEAVSLWGHVPAYLQKSPRVVVRIVGILNKALGLLCPIDALQQRAIEFDRKIHEALMKDPNLKLFVESLGRETGSTKTSKSDYKVIRLNDFLRKGSHDDPVR